MESFAEGDLVLDEGKKSECKQCDSNHALMANWCDEVERNMKGTVGMLGLLMETPLEPKQEEYLIHLEKSADRVMKALHDVSIYNKSFRTSSHDTLIDVEINVMDRAIDYCWTSLLREDDDIQKDIDISFFFSINSTPLPQLPVFFGDLAAIQRVVINSIIIGLQFVPVIVGVGSSKSRIEETISVVFDIQENRSLNIKIIHSNASMTDFRNFMKNPKSKYDLFPEGTSHPWVGPNQILILWKTCENLCFNIGGTFGICEGKNPDHECCLEASIPIELPPHPTPLHGDLMKLPLKPFTAASKSLSILLLCLHESLAKEITIYAESMGHKVNYGNI